MHIDVASKPKEKTDYRLNIYLNCKHVRESLSYSVEIAKLISELCYSRDTIRTVEERIHYVYPISGGLSFYKREKVLIWDNFDYPKFSTVLGSDLNIFEALDSLPENKYKTFINANRKFMLQNDVNLFVSNLPFEQYAQDMFPSQGKYITKLLHKDILFDTERAKVQAISKMIPFTVEIRPSFIRLYVDSYYLTGDIQDLGIMDLKQEVDLRSEETLAADLKPIVETILSLSEAYTFRNKEGLKEMFFR